MKNTDYPVHYSYRIAALSHHMHQKANYYTNWSWCSWYIFNLFAYYTAWQLLQCLLPTYAFASGSSEDLFWRSISSSQGSIPLSFNPFRFCFYQYYFHFSFFLNLLFSDINNSAQEFSESHRSFSMKLEGPFRLIYRALTTIKAGRSTREWIKLWIEINFYVTSTKHTTARWQGRSAAMTTSMHALWRRCSFLIQTILVVRHTWLLHITSMEESCWKTTIVWPSWMAVIAVTLSKCYETELAWSELWNHFPWATSFVLMASPCHQLKQSKLSNIANILTTILRCKATFTDSIKSPLSVTRVLEEDCDIRFVDVRKTDNFEAMSSSPISACQL